MYLNKQESYHIRKILRKCKLTNSEATLYVGSMQHYEAHHGAKALVGYFKFLKHKLLEEGQVFFNRSTKSKIVIILRSLLQRLEDGIIYALRILNIGGRWKSEEPRKGAYQKFSNAVKGTVVERAIPKLGMTIQQQRTFADAVSTAHISFKPLVSQTTHILEGGGTTTGPGRIAPELYAMTMAGPLYREFEHYISDLFDIPLEGRVLLLKNSLLYKTPIVGKIAGLTKDRGLKTRFVANLVKGWQVAISPLVRALQAFLKVQPESALYDQQGAVLWMAERLKEGRKVTSIDLKDSTDNLPRYIFINLMYDFIGRNFNTSREFALFTQAFLLDVRLQELGTYLTPFEDITVHYGRGQAMGRWSSKYQLDMTMLYLARSVGGNEYNCRINGDDIFFSNTRVARRFLKLLNYLEVPISDMKTYVDKDFGEFSGRLVTRKLGILPVFKGAVTDWRDDPFGPLRQYGLAGLDLLPKKVRHKVKKVVSLSKDQNLKHVTEQLGNPFEGFIPKSGAPVFNKQGFSELWVTQVFAKEAEELTTKLYNEYNKRERFMRPRRGRTSFQSRRFSKAVQKEQAQHLNELRQDRIFGRSAVQRFKEPLTRLNLFVDYLQSSVVKTSDGHFINGYGSITTDAIVERLVKLDLLADKTSYDSDPSVRKGKRFMLYVDKVYKELREWERQNGF